MNAPSTVDVRCPRCDVPIVCTLEIKPVSERLTDHDVEVVKTTASVPDLAEKFAAHYRDAGHVNTVTWCISGSPAGRVGLPGLAENLSGLIGNLGERAGHAFAEAFDPDEDLRIRNLVTAGYTPASAAAAVQAGDKSLLRHAAVQRAIDRAADAVGRANAAQAKLDDRRAAGE